MLRSLAAAALLSAVALAAAPASADTAPIILTIKDHAFQPAEVTVPAGQKVTLLVKNTDATPEEFESDDLHREKIIQGGQEATIVIGPLKPGSYSFFGEFHEDTAQGRVIAE